MYFPVWSHEQALTLHLYFKLLVEVDHGVRGEEFTGVSPESVEAAASGVEAE